MKGDQRARGAQIGIQMASSMMEVDETIVQDLKPRGSPGCSKRGLLHQPVQNQGDEQDVDITHPVPDPTLENKLKGTSKVTFIEKGFYPDLEKYLWELLKTDKIKSQEFDITFNPKFYSGWSSIKANFRDTKGRPEEGTSGRVYKMKDMQTMQNLATKIMKDPNKLNVHEVMVPLKLIRSTYIAKIFGLVSSKGRLMLIFEDAGVPLTDDAFLNDIRIQILNEPVGLEGLMLQLYQIVMELAMAGYTHGDIKPQNICIDKISRIIKLVDFGSCINHWTNRNVQVLCTPEYVDPHKCKLICQPKRGEPHSLTEADDVYALGLVALFILRGQHPMVEFIPVDAKNSTEMRKIRIKKIMALTQENLNAIIKATSEQMTIRSMSEPMRILLDNVLVIDDVSRRWMAKAAVDHLEGVVRPLLPKEVGNIQKLNVDLRGGVLTHGDEVIHQEQDMTYGDEGLSESMNIPRAVNNLQDQVELSDWEKLAIACGGQPCLVQRQVQDMSSSRAQPGMSYLNAAQTQEEHVPGPAGNLPNLAALLSDDS